nr:MAG TPA: hypothetical protein [Caudoviricetes sp.]
MNATEDATLINWTLTSDDRWEATVRGVTYSIEWRNNQYCLYRGPERKKIDSNKSLLLLKWITECL